MKKSYETFIKALQLLSCYEADGLQGEYFLNTGHDVIYARVDPGCMSDTDNMLMREYGWHVDSESNNWMYYI